jgi:hypothetical protein
VGDLTLEGGGEGVGRRENEEEIPVNILGKEGGG